MVEDQWDGDLPGAPVAILRKQVVAAPVTRSGRRGAPPGNQRALKHGAFTRERRGRAAAVRALISGTDALTARIEELTQSLRRHRKRGPRKWVLPR